MNEPKKLSRREEMEKAEEEARQRRDEWLEKENAKRKDAYGDMDYAEEQLLAGMDAGIPIG